MLIGGSNGSESTDRSRMSQQQRYNAAFEQCMYSKGNQVPGYYAPPAYSPPPPPPPGTPPPPPPDGQ
jgi:hypothetical protein